MIDKYLEEERSLAGNYLNAVEGGREISDSEEFKEYAGSNGVRAELLQRWIDYLAEEESRSHPVLRSWFSEYESGNREEGVAYYNEAFAAVVKEEGEWDEEIKSFLEEEGTPLNPSRESVEDWIGRKIRGDTGELTGKIQELDWTHPGAPIRAHILEDIPEPKDSPVYKRGTLSDWERRCRASICRFWLILREADIRPAAAGLNWLRILPVRIILSQRGFS